MKILLTNKMVQMPEYLVTIGAVGEYFSEYVNQICDKFQISSEIAAVLTQKYRADVLIDNVDNMVILERHSEKDKSVVYDYRVAIIKNLDQALSCVVGYIANGRDADLHVPIDPIDYFTPIYIAVSGVKYNLCCKTLKNSLEFYLEEK